MSREPDITITGRSESDADIAATLRGYVARFELTSPMVKQMMLDAAAEVERLTNAIRRIDGINDNPARYNPAIDDVCAVILRPELKS